jgi:hypothetical protein
LALALIALVAGAGTPRAFAQSAAPADDSVTHSLKATWLAETQIQGRRAVAMAKGIAADKLTWKPAPDNNAAANGELADLFLRLAYSCWIRPNQFGAAPPAGFDLKVKADDYANSTRDKAKIVEQLSQAFAYAEDVLRKLPDSDLQRHVKLPNGRDSTVVSLVAAWVEYNSEHVGQLMIYSRVNGFTPPTPGQVATPENGR